MGYELTVNHPTDEKYYQYAIKEQIVTIFNQVIKKIKFKKFIMFLMNV